MRAAHLSIEKYLWFLDDLDCKEFLSCLVSGQANLVKHMASSER